MTNKYQACLSGDCFYFDAYGADLYYNDDEVLILEIDPGGDKTVVIELEMDCTLNLFNEGTPKFISDQDRAWEQFTAPLDPTDDIVDDIRISNVNTGPYYFTTT